MGCSCSLRSNIYLMDCGLPCTHIYWSSLHKLRKILLLKYLCSRDQPWKFSERKDLYLKLLNFADVWLNASVIISWSVPSIWSTARYQVASYPGYLFLYMGRNPGTRLVSGEPGVTSCSRRSNIYLGSVGFLARLFIDHCCVSSADICSLTQHYS